MPFSVVSFDFVGPLFIKTSGVTNKVWICLYTCAIVRAVRDLNTTTFLSSFRKFSSRQELPHLIISDNGQTFKAAATIIRRMFASAEVKEHFHNQPVKWTFNLQEPLTLSHLLFGHRLLRLPSCNYPEDFDYNTT